MKKQFILGMAMTMLVSAAMATGTKMSGPQLDARISERASHATKSGSLAGVDYSDAAKTRDSLANALAKNNNGLDIEALKRAQGESLTVDVAGQKETSSVGDLAKRTQMINQEVAALKEARVELDAQASAKVAVQEKGVQLNAQILSMTIARSSGVKPGSARTAEQITKDSAGFDKFAVEYTHVLESGSAKEIESYNSLAQAMIESRTDASVTKDEAYDKAMTKVYGAKAETKKKELEGCSRG